MLISLILTLLPEAVASYSVFSGVFEPRVAASSPHKRGNDCPSSDFTAHNGLKFKPLCLQNIPFNDLLNISAVNMDECMELCASYILLQQPCWGISYNFNDQNCYIKNHTGASATPVPELSTHSAIAINFNSNPDIPCPWPNATEHQTSNGMEFTVLCDQDMPFDDYCPDNGPTSTALQNGICPYHADSLEDCMELCSAAIPLCKAVTYNPGMDTSYGNCFTKTDFSPSNYHSTASQTARHMAVVANLATLDASCTNGSIHTSPNGEQFSVNCNNDIPNNDLHFVHSTNLSYCIDFCSTYSNATTGDCVAVVFDSSQLNGWQNCYLKSSGGAKTAKISYHYAVKVGDAPRNATGSSSDSGTPGSSTPPKTKSKSRAWIAGAIVGSVAGVALVAAVILFFLRTRRRSAPPQSELQALQPSDEKQVAIKESVPEAHGLLTQEMPTLESSRYELPVEEAAHELPGDQRQ